MISLKNYCFENLINIFEGATGIKMSTSKNIKLFVDYLKEHQKNHKCIIPDSEDIRKQYSEFENWYCELGNESDALFFLKTNDNLCMYEPNVKNMSDEELDKYSIKREAETYYLPNINVKIQATSKKINSSKSDLKIWPDFWDKFIVKGEHQLEENAKMPTTVIDFKNQGAYILKDISLIKKDLYKSFENIFGKESVLTNIFNNDIKKYLSELKGDDRQEISKNMANVLSEPLAILALIENIDDVQNKIRDEFKPEDLGELYEIIIPIKQNWPVADYYAHFKNLPDRLIAISVKSNGAGNSSTIMGCLPVVALDNINIGKNDKLALLNFFNEIIQQCKDENSKVEFKLSNDLSNDLKNISLYTLALLKEETINTKISNAKKLVNTFNKLIDLIKSETELYNQLHKICELEGTNVIEKIFICLFNTNQKTIELIKNAVGDATSCYKITVHDSGNVKCIKQSPESGSFKLKYKGGGQGLKLIVKDNKLIDVKLGHKTSQGQWLGYTFH